MLDVLKDLENDISSAVFSLCRIEKYDCVPTHTHTHTHTHTYIYIFME